MMRSVWDEYPEEKKVVRNESRQEILKKLERRAEYYGEPLRTPHSDDYCRYYGISDPRSHLNK